MSYLFGDLLSIDWPDIPTLSLAIAGGALVAGLRHWREQVRLVTDADIAVSEGAKCRLATTYFYVGGQARCHGVGDGQSVRY